jgi:hypothetical protein
MPSRAAIMLSYTLFYNITGAFVGFPLDCSIESLLGIVMWLLNNNGRNSHIPAVLIFYRGPSYLLLLLEVEFIGLHITLMCCQLWIGGGDGDGEPPVLARHYFLYHKRCCQYLSLRRYGERRGSVSVRMVIASLGVVGTACYLNVLCLTGIICTIYFKKDRISRVNPYCVSTQFLFVAIYIYFYTFVALAPCIKGGCQGE